MTMKFNLSDKDDKDTKDIFERQLRFANKGWLLAIFFALAFIVQNIIYVLLPKEVMAVDENGQVIGQVIFDEPALRSRDMVLGDVKLWFSRCLSINKINIYNDLALCISHYSDELSDERLIEYAETKRPAPNVEGRASNQEELYSYPDFIENFGCSRDQIQFNDETTQVQRLNDNRFEAILEGNVICNDGRKPVGSPFRTKVKGYLAYKNTQDRPFGIVIDQNLEDI